MSQEKTDKEESELKKLKDKIEELEQDLEECQREKEKYLSGWQRARADLLNFKKDKEQRLEKAEQKTRRELIEDFLPTLDNLERAKNNVKNSELVEGLTQIEKEMRNILESYGVKKIKTEGEQFDPQFHQAVEQVPSEQPEGTVVEEVKAGYKTQQQVIRTAEVKVAANNK